MLEYLIIFYILVLYSSLSTFNLTLHYISLNRVQIRFLVCISNITRRMPIFVLIFVVIILSPNVSNLVSTFSQSTHLHRSVHLSLLEEHPHFPLMHFVFLHLQELISMNIREQAVGPSLLPATWPTFPLSLPIHCQLDSKVLD